MNWSCFFAVAFLVALLLVRNWLLEIVAAADDIADDVREESEGVRFQSHDNAGAA